MVHSSPKLKIEKTKPDILWISKLARVSLEEATKYVLEAESDLELETHLKKTLPKGGRNNYVQIAAPFELYALTRLKKPNHIVEIGVSAGVSSAYFLKALERNGRGRLHSIDLPEMEGPFGPQKKISWAIPRGKYSGWAVPKSLRNNWDIRLGSSAELLPSLISELDRVGIFLYDVPYTIESAKADFQVVNSKLSKKSVVLADNALVPISWWAKLRNVHAIRRRGTGLRGFSIS